MLRSRAHAQDTSDDGLALDLLEGRLDADQLTAEP